MSNMSVVGDVAKSVLVFFCGYFVFTMIVQALTGQTALAMFMLIGLSIPLAIILHGHMQDRKGKKKTMAAQ